MSATTPAAPRAPTRRPGPAGAARTCVLQGLGLLALLLWNYQAVIAGLLKDWRNDPNYSVGQLVPLAALGLVWARRRELAGLALRVAPAGLLLVAAGLGLRLCGLVYLYEAVERYSLIVTAAGLTWFVAGGAVARRLWWLWVFLPLMIPLPNPVHNALAGPLQGWATSATLLLLELAGVTVSREGNVLTLNEHVEVGVVEACSGLRMLTAFIVVAAVLALLVPRPRWQKCVLVLSSIPIALACNVLRLAATAGLFLAGVSDVATTFFHDFAGVSMMPVAVAMLLAELRLLGRLRHEGGCGARTPSPAAS